jgi:hypothetical protein
VMPSASKAALMRAGRRSSVECMMGGSYIQLNSRVKRNRRPGRDRARPSPARRGPPARPPRSAPRDRSSRPRRPGCGARGSHRAGSGAGGLRGPPRGRRGRPARTSAGRWAGTDGTAGRAAGTAGRRDTAGAGSTLQSSAASSSAAGHSCVASRRDAGRSRLDRSDSADLALVSRREAASLEASHHPSRQHPHGPSQPSEDDRQAID